MSLKRRYYVPILLLAVVVATAVAVQQYLENFHINVQVDVLEDILEEQKLELAAYRSLETADSLFHAGRYSAAIDAYRAAELDSTFQLDARIDHARRLNRLWVMLDTLQNREPRILRIVETLEPPKPVAVSRLPLETSRPNDYDSLAFALEKAELQIRNLEKRITRNSGGNYLTFKSPQGNDIYYVGDVRGGKAEGNGVALFSTGSRYIGSWKDNKKHGNGRFLWKDGAYYEGEYLNNQRHGQGTYKFPDGSQYVGTWADDLRDGEGVFYDKKGKIVAQGVWRKDELVEQQ